MREVLALLRAGWIAALSYRMNLLFSFTGLALMLAPLYFVAQALQPIAASSIRSEGGHYLAFLIVGLAVLGLLQTALLALPLALGAGISSGTLEAMLATPARIPALLVGLISYECSWSAVRAGVMLLVGIAMGVSVNPAGIPIAVLALGLTLAAYFGISLALAAMILVFRTTGPLGTGVLAGSALLGGAYYSTSVIPSWIQHLSAVVPLTYGLRATRQALLTGAPPTGLWTDIAMVAGFAVLLLGAGGLLFMAGLNHARREGSLGQY
jgi:ABC-2 type transport system permease protein